MKKSFIEKTHFKPWKNHFEIKLNFPSWRKMMGYQGGFNYNCQTKAKILHCHRKFRKFYATPVYWNCHCRRLFYNCHPVNCKFLCHRPQTSKLYNFFILFHICHQVYFCLEKYLNLFERILEEEGLEQDCWDLGQNFTFLQEGEGNGKK